MAPTVPARFAATSRRSIRMLRLKWRVTAFPIAMPAITSPRQKPTSPIERCSCDAMMNGAEAMNA